MGVGTCAFTKPALGKSAARGAWRAARGPVRPGAVAPGPPAVSQRWQTHVLYYHDPLRPRSTVSGAKSRESPRPPRWDPAQGSQPGVPAPWYIGLSYHVGLRAAALAAGRRPARARRLKSGAQNGHPAPHIARARTSGLAPIMPDFSERQCNTKGPERVARFTVGPLKWAKRSQRATAPGLPPRASIVDPEDEELWWRTRRGVVWSLLHGLRPVAVKCKHWKSCKPP